MSKRRSSLVTRASRLPLALLPIVLGGCDMVTMNPTGDIAVQQRDLILFSVCVMLLVIVPVMVLTVLFAIRYRGGNAKGLYDPSFHHSTTLELVIWSCPLFIIIALSAVTWTSTHLLDPFRPLARIAPGRPVPPGTTPLNVQVVALDWKWLFIYPDLGIAAVNELALPVDVPVRFSITATDQFDTFYAPTLAGMVYAMPAMRSELNAVLNKPGESWGYSGNYTGRGYSDMRFKLRGVTPADFDRWVADVKGAGGSLQTANFIQMAKPSEKAPVAYFSSVQPGLFDRVVNRCIEPGKTCMVDLMRHDMEMSGNSHGSSMDGEMPAGREAEPLVGDRPKAALQKTPEEKGTSPNVTDPSQPGEAKHRDHSPSPSSPPPPRAPGGPGPLAPRQP